MGMIYDIHMIYVDMWVCGKMVGMIDDINMIFVDMWVGWWICGGYEGIRRGSYCKDCICVGIKKLRSFFLNIYYQTLFEYMYTRSLGALRAPTSSLRPFGPA